MEIFKRNYNAVVKRGKITPETTDVEFALKAKEELNEVFKELSKNEINDENLDFEFADLLIVCSSRLIQRGINLEEILTKIAEKNENRAKS